MLSQPQCGLENHVIESMSGCVFCSKQAVSRVGPYKDPKDTLSICSLFYVNEHPHSAAHFPETLPNECSLVATNTAGIQLSGPKPKYWSDIGTR